MVRRVWQRRAVMAAMNLRARRRDQGQDISPGFTLSNLLPPTRSYLLLSNHLPIMPSYYADSISTH
jgi:hypothetical protein